MRLAAPRAGSVSFPRLTFDLQDWSGAAVLLLIVALTIVSGLDYRLSVPFQTHRRPHLIGRQLLNQAFRGMIGAG